MIFHHTHTQVLDGTKTQSRRLVKPGQYCEKIRLRGGEVIINMVATRTQDNYLGRLKWEVGKTYAVQPGRTQKEAGRIRITAIRRERVQEISHNNALAEGIKLQGRHAMWVDPRDRFARLWDSIHTKSGTRWEDNPEVWVLEFELVEQEG